MKPLLPEELYYRLCEERGVTPKENAAFSRAEIRKRHEEIDRRIELQQIEEEYNDIR